MLYDEENKRFSNDITESTSGRHLSARFEAPILFEHSHGIGTHYRKCINFPILVQTVEFETTLLEVIKLLTNLKIQFKLEQLLL
ncbi:hypothetical protein V1478_004921 [Vespula squamosa]|uniref:Uncharacterized protein n=1 Tax=Vespula squamosa TaxID=30214 RepID=A0ABD2BF59_VESSQ